MPDRTRSGPSRPPVLLDTDIGSDVDDALALVLAARSPEIELSSVTTVAAKTEVRARLARRLLELTGCRDIPVVAGHGRPMRAERFASFMPDGLWLGHEGWGVLSEAEIEEAADETPDGQAAIDALTKQIEAADGDSIVVTIGPCTNVGAALRDRPDLAASIAQLVVMGGAIEPPVLAGAEVSPLAEFNLNADREAAGIVLEAGIPTTIVPVDLTIKTLLTKADVGGLSSSGDPVAQALAALLDIWAPIFRRLVVSMGASENAVGDWVCHLHDPLALLTVIDPSLFVFEEVQIDLREEDGVLRTHASRDGIPVRLAKEVDIGAATALILRRLKGDM